MLKFADIWACEVAQQLRACAILPQLNSSFTPRTTLGGCLKLQLKENLIHLTFEAPELMSTQLKIKITNIQCNLFLSAFNFFIILDIILLFEQTMCILKIRAIQ